MKGTIADPAQVKPLKSRSHRDRKHFIGSKLPDDINVSVLVAIALESKYLRKYVIGKNLRTAISKPQKNKS
ncbi:hypothetical protein [Agrobacterium vitis]|uniref:hypothetical protein n=1 Tax=Agrobacterium vitis TaxID=373 RepID=UPI003D2781C1